MLYGTNSLEINEPNNGGGWENKVSVSSLKELREQLEDLSGILSFEDNAYGVENAHINVQGTVYSSNVDIDSYRSYLTAPSTQQGSTNSWGGYHYNEVNGLPDTNSLELPLQYANIFQSINNATRGANSENTYLAFDIDHSNLHLSNGFDYTPGNSIGYNNRIDKNPEYVVSLNDSFWADYDRYAANIESQKRIGDNINLEIKGLTNSSIDLSSIKNSLDKGEAIGDMLINSDLP